MTVYLLAVDEFCFLADFLALTFQCLGTGDQSKCQRKRQLRKGAVQKAARWLRGLAGRPMSEVLEQHPPRNVLVDGF